MLWLLFLVNFGLSIPRASRDDAGITVEPSAVKQYSPREQG